jgi:hypothetical protein
VSQIERVAFPVTRCDQRFGDIFLGDAFLRAVVLPVFLRGVLRAAVLPARAFFRRSVILYSLLFQPKNDAGADRFLCRNAGNSRVPRALTNVAGTKVADSHGSEL